MRAVILSWSGGVKQYIVFSHQHLAPLSVTKYPVSESFPHGILFLCSDRGFFFVQHTLLFPILHYNVIHTAVLQIQRIL